ncbi:pathway-specific nitrogen regulator, partial [Coniochaeta sp. 2T2.1]
HDNFYHEEASTHTEDSYLHDEMQRADLEDDGYDVASEHDDVHHDDTSTHDESSLLEASQHGDISLGEDEPSHVGGPDIEYEHAFDDDQAQQEDDGPVSHADDYEPDSRRTSAISDSSDRRGSLRTEALIQAAARAVVAQIEERAIAAVHSHRASLSPSHADDRDTSLLGTTSHDVDDHKHSPISPSVSNTPSRRESSTSTGSQVHHHQTSSSDSGSHHDPSDSDVFSDRSSNRHSISSAASDSEPTPTPKIKSGGTPTHSRHSGISSISQYDDHQDAFTPTTKSSSSGTRIPFRTPSDVRAIQMSSPTPSVFNGASPRSAKRNVLSGGGSAQYSPKGRTPTRFLKKRDDPPLVLLHVTLLPLRWVWGEVVDGLDSATGFGFKASDELTRLMDAWRQLQDRVGDTVLERGVLLPHPQYDYEVLEERLLEALELPVRRRARILECGHYLGPGNDVEEGESESEQEDEYDVQTGRFGRKEKRHWCTTCKGEIKYESLGEGRVFRVKVYASNGLMKAGAWEACWKEMERVDVEVEPLVGAGLHRELERLAVCQVEEEERRQREADEEERARHEDAMRADEELHAQEEVHLPTPLYDSHRGQPEVLSSPTHPTMHASPPSQIPTSPTIHITRSPSPIPRDIDASEARRRRDEARLREIYGSSPPPTSSFSHIDDTATTIPTSTFAEPPTSSFRSDVQDTAHTTSTYHAPPSPRSPSEEAAERRTQRRTTTGTGAYQGASLPELVFEAVKVLMRDRRNVVIAVLGVFVLLLAMRPREVDVAYRVAPVARDDVVMGVPGKMGAQKLEIVDVTTAEEVLTLTVSATLASEAADEAAEASPTDSVVDQTPGEVLVVDTKSTRREALPSVSEAATSSSSASTAAAKEETVTEKKVVRIVETVTETVKVSVTATESVAVPPETKAAIVLAKKAAVVGAKVDIDSDTVWSLAAPDLGVEVCPVREDVCGMASVF